MSIVARLAVLRPALTAAAALLIAACTSLPGPTEGPSATAPSASVGPSAAEASATPRACTADPRPSLVVPAWGERVWYEVFVRSFADSNGDGIGDLRGLIDHLDYVNDGVASGRDLADCAPAGAQSRSSLRVR